MSTAVMEAVITQHVKELKLPTVGREYQALARQARQDGWPTRTICGSFWTRSFAHAVTGQLSDVIREATVSGHQDLGSDRLGCAGGCLSSRDRGAGKLRVLGRCR